MGGEWKLTTTERKRILLQNIYGVDIDAQAVETTKLSLLLKVLEGESEQTLATQLRFYHERALPDLGRNIKCGNSLIGPDFYEQSEMLFLDEEERYRINVFDWNAEFPEIMKAGGFNAVIGNPPYVRMELFKEIKIYLASRYESHDERTDLYVYFVERSLELLRRGGLYGVIVSNKWVRSKYGEKLRAVVEKSGTIESIIDFGELPVFQKAATFPAIFIMRGGRHGDAYMFSLTQGIDRDTFNAIRSGITLLARVEQENRNVISSSALGGKVWRLNVGQIEDLLQRLRSVGPPLLEYSGGKIRYGIKTGLVEAFVIDSETKRRLLRESPAAERMIKPYVIGDDVRKYHIRETNRFLIYTFHDIDMRGCASVLGHLERFKAKLQQRATEQEWYELQQPQHRYVPDYESPKIIYPDIAKESRFAFDDAKMYPADTTFVIPLADLYLLGVLNSKLAFFYFSHVCPVLGDVRHGGRLRMKLNYVQEFPVKVSGAANKDRHDRMVSLVERMLALNRELAAAKTAHTKINLQRQIDASDTQIDQLVYELYGLSEDEIRIVEGAAR
jgi:Eco57I restriction-modification methylase/restriction endonuclease TaqI-like protein/restriction-modification enzyme MmeI-like protein